MSRILCYTVLLFIHIFISKTEAVNYVRSYDLGGGGLKTALLRYDDKSQEIKFVESEVQLGMCPEGIEVNKWIRIRMQEVLKKNLDEEVNSDYLFAFSLAGLNKLRANPLPTSDISVLFDLPSDRTRCIDDGAAHLIASLHTLKDKLPSGPIWNFSIGTGVGFGFSYSDHNIRNLYDFWKFFGHAPWRSIEPSTGKKVWFACGSKRGFDQIVSENGGVADHDAFIQFASRWKSYIETSILDYGRIDCSDKYWGIPSAVVFTGGYIDFYENHLADALQEIGLTVPSFTGPKHAGLLGAALNAAINCSVTTPLIKAIEKEELQNMHLLLEKGIDVNARDALCNSPLVHAVNSGKIDFVNLLLAFGAEVNAPDFCFQTPIYFAIRNNDFEMVELLIKKGADVNNSDYWKQTPLDFSKEDKQIELLLLNYGAIGTNGER